MAKKEGSNLLVPGLLILVVVFGGLLLFGGDKGDLSTGDVTDTGTKDDTSSGEKVVAVTDKIQSGELELFLRAGNGGTGSQSKVVLLDSSYAKFDKDGKFDEDATRYGIMAPHYNKGLTSLMAFPGGGTPKEISASSGEWSEPQLVASKGDKFVVYTFEDTSPAAADNVTTAHLMELKSFDVGNSKWVAQDTDSKSYWNIYDYGSYDWYDGTDTIKNGYVYDDSASADTGVIITWYSRASINDAMLVDGAVYIAAPSNFTGKFKSLSVTDKMGHNKKFTSLTKAENYGGTDPINIASTVLTAAPTNWNYYYVGALGKDMMTLNTETDNNRLSWELESDSYGSNVTVNVSMVMNAGAISSSNGAFEIADNFEVQLGESTGADTGSGFV